MVREAVQLFENDARLSAVMKRMNQAGPVQLPFATAISFEFGRKASLSWRLSEFEKENIRDALNDEHFMTRALTLKSVLR